MAVSDPIVLAAEARAVIAKLHQRNDVVVKFKTDESTYAEDLLDEHDKKAPGHFRPDKKILTLNLDTLVKAPKKHPTQLRDVEDFRQYPVLAGVAAHESAHARFSLWDAGFVPMALPNPEYDMAHVHDDEAEGVSETECILSIEEFPVGKDGALRRLAVALEEPRVERLGVKTFTKTWRAAMGFSSTHLILESVDDMNSDDVAPLDSAINLMVLIGGRVTAGTLGSSTQSRQAVQKIMDSAEAILLTALPDKPNAYSDIMQIISRAVMNNDHADALPHLEHARQILAIVHPESQGDPDSSGGQGSGEGEEGGLAAGSAPGEGGADSEGDGEQSDLDKALSELADKLSQELGDLGQVAEKEADAAEQEAGEPPTQSGYGATNSNRDTVIRAHETPTKADRELYRRASKWMEELVQPTVTEREFGQWNPSGGARLNVRTFIRDNIAGNVATQRNDWDRVSETVKSAPPVKLGIMLDGSGSMTSWARPSASIAWAAANAAADLPESRTVSVLFGDRATVTQKPGHGTQKTVAVANTNGGWENFTAGAALVEEALWLDEDEAGDPNNTLIIIVSDLAFYGEGQAVGFGRKTKEWAEKGYRVVSIGGRNGICDTSHVEIQTIEQLFS